MMAIKECYLELNNNKGKTPIEIIQNKGNIENKIYHLKLILEGGKQIQEFEALSYNSDTN